MARICIVTPSALGSNPRVVKEAQALSEAGHSVHVIAVRTLDAVDPRDEAILSTARWSSERVDLRSSWRWRLRRLVQIIHRLASKRFGRVLDTAHGVATTDLIRRAKAWPADLYIAHYVAALPAAANAAQHHGAQYAFDAEDFHPGDLPDIPENAFENRLIRSIEARYLPGCAYVSAASPGIADAYANAYGIAPPVVILNVFPRDQAPSLASAAGAAKPGPSVYWFSQTIGPDRGLECAVKAIAIAKSKPHLYCRGAPAPGFADQLLELARTEGISGHVHILESASPMEMERLASAYDLGLSGETGRTLNRAIALTNKQFTYLLAGVPTLLSDIPSHRKFAGSAEGAAFLFECENSTSLAAVIDGLLCDSTALQTARVCAYQLGQTLFNWEIEQVKLLNVVHSAITESD